jgi:hypothetical protein
MTRRGGSKVKPSFSGVTVKLPLVGTEGKSKLPRWSVRVMAESAPESVDEHVGDARNPPGRESSP